MDNEERSRIQPYPIHPTERALAFSLLQAALQYDVQTVQDYLSQRVNLNVRFSDPKTISLKSGQEYSMIYWILKSQELSSIEKVHLCEIFFQTQAVQIDASEKVEISTMLNQILYSTIPEKLLKPITDNDEEEQKRKKNLDLLNEAKNKISNLQNALMHAVVFNQAHNSTNHTSFSSDSPHLDSAITYLSPLEIVQKAQEKYNSLESYSQRDRTFKINEIVRDVYNLPQHTSLQEEHFAMFCMDIVAASDINDLNSETHTSFSDLFAIAQQGFASRMSHQRMTNIQDLAYCFIQDDLYGLSASSERYGSQSENILNVYRSSLYDRFFTSSAERMRIVALKMSEIYQEKNMTLSARHVKQSKIKDAITDYDQKNIKGLNIRFCGQNFG